jgi:WD40 repeat protein
MRVFFVFKPKSNNLKTRIFRDLRTKHPKKGFAGLSQKHEKSTIWGGRFLPQNRDVFVALGGSGNLSLWQYKYPANRSAKSEDDGEKVGVVGEVVKLQDSQLGDQPVSGFDWSPDKTGLAVCTAFDQKIRLVIVTKLNTL